MRADLASRHYLPAAFDHRGIRILLVGCGGNGAQMLMGLASLHTALRAISSRSLHVTVVDDDVVTEANLGRQPFYRCDVGHSKARTLTERINLAHGLAWTAVHGRAPAAVGVANFDILISCVDTASARRALGGAMEEGGAVPAYWMDLGNRASDGQYLIGCPARARTTSTCRPCSRPSQNSPTKALKTTMHHPVPSRKRSSASRCSSIACWRAMPSRCCSISSDGDRLAMPAPSSISPVVGQCRFRCRATETAGGGTG